MIPGEPDQLRWLRRPETIAAAASMLFLFAAITAIVGAVFVAAALAALAIALSALVWLAVRMERAEADAALREARRDGMGLIVVASHDMRQPLHAITLYLAALNKRVDGDEARAILAKVEAATDALSSLVSDLARYTQLRSGEIKPDVAVFALRPLLEKLAAPEIVAPDLIVSSDPSLLEEALAIVVRHAQARGGARIEASARDGAIEIVVCDRGPDLSPDEQQHMFAPFDRGEGGQASQRLTLAIARETARVLGGALSASSPPGEGARYMLRLPVGGIANNKA